MSKHYHAILCCSVVVTVAVLFNLTDGRGVHGRCRVEKARHGAHVNCSHLSLNHVPQHIPPNTVLLDLSNNQIKTIKDNDFIRLRRLRTLLLNRNLVTSIAPKAFAALRALEFLDISSNRLNIIANETFKENLKLQYLYLHNNTYNLTYMDTPISHLHNLRNLTIDIRNNFRFGKGFTKLANLSSLTVYSRKILSLENNSFTGLKSNRIRVLKLLFYHDVSIWSSLATEYLSPFRYLKELTVHFGGPWNNIKDVLHTLNGLAGKNLDVLNIGSNYMFVGQTQILRDEDLEPLSKICVKRLDMSKDFILRFSSKVLWSYSNFSECLEEINLSGNLFSMNDHLFLIYLGNMRKIKKINIANVPLYENGWFSGKSLTQDTMATPSKRDNKLGIFQQISKNVNLTVYASKTLETMDVHGIHVDFGFDNMNLLLNFSGLKTLKAGNTDLEFCSLPNTMLFRMISKLEYLDITRWKCSSLNPKLFTVAHPGFSSLKTLIAQNAQLDMGLARDKEGNLFARLKKLEMINLSQNELRSLHGNLFRHQKHLKSVHLDANNFDRIPRTVLDIPNLKHLSMRKNRFEYLDIIERQAVGKWNISMDFRGNEFHCTCEHLLFLQWMVKQQHKFKHLEEIACKDGSNITDVLKELREMELKCMSKTLFTATSTIFVVFTSLIIALTLCYRFRYALMHYYFQYTKQDSGMTFDHDVFISYAYRNGETLLDESFVIGTLYSKLEELGLKVVFDGKDFLPGNAITYSVHEFMDRSKNLVIVMSRNFLQYENSECHIEMAKIHTFAKKRSSLIVLFIDDTCKEDVMDSFKNMWWKVEFLKWPTDDQEEEKRALFWQHLNALLNE